VKIELKKKVYQPAYLDPVDGYSKKQLLFEVRADALTGHRSRILRFRRRKLPEVRISTEMLEASKAGCPFCQEQIFSSTPHFIPGIAPEGRMNRGGAWLFPNSFPYALHNWVVVLSGDHFLHLDRFSVELLRDGFLVARDGIVRLRESDSLMGYASINWNYLPQAGGGLFHPHLQVVVEDQATDSHGRVMDGVKKYREENGSSFWQDYLSEEMRRGERYIGNRGDVHFIAAFAPRGILGEVLILFRDRVGIEEIGEQDWTDFIEGLNGILRYLLEKCIYSFNLSLFFEPTRDSGSWVYGRLCPRMTLPPWNTSDINYLEKLHGEVICVVSPEEFCTELKPYF
jgi:galactose-1-phosphate uridylyltransferase